MGTTELEAFVIDVVLALVTLTATTALLWVWFRWLAGQAMEGSGHSPPTRHRPDLGPPSVSLEVQAEIAELEALWNLPREGPTAH